MFIESSILMRHNDELAQHQCLLNFKRDMMFGAIAIGNYHQFAYWTNQFQFRVSWLNSRLNERVVYNSFALFCQLCYTNISCLFWSWLYSKTMYGSMLSSLMKNDVYRIPKHTQKKKSTFNIWNEFDAHNIHNDNGKRCEKCNKNWVIFGLPLVWVFGIAYDMLLSCSLEFLIFTNQKS